MKKEKPLPTPPKTAFGRKKPSEQPDDQGGLIADRMAAAMAEGKLDDFLKQEMPDNEYAKNLVNMMMGMTGMMPMVDQTTASLPHVQEQQPVSSEKKVTEQISPTTEVPEDVKKAVTNGDVKGLKDLLRREYLRRTPGADLGMSEEDVTIQPQPSGIPTIDKDLIDAMVQIAKDNSVTMDWMILRAIKVYIQEYQKTGRL
jgi:predicted amidohydrolase YtcJ